MILLQDLWVHLLLQSYGENRNKYKQTFNSVRIRTDTRTTTKSNFIGKRDKSPGGILRDWQKSLLEVYNVGGSVSKYKKTKPAVYFTKKTLTGLDK
jgi:hypothetical protein